MKQYDGNPNGLPFFTRKIRTAYNNCMRIIEYDREKAVNYAKRWAFGRNPEYYNFDRLGGDCTNFASQCLYAGVGIMNFTPDVGWYYKTSNDRAAAWTGVEYFYRFLTGNLQGVGNGSGPFAQETTIENLQIGDFIQFGRVTGDFYHTPVVVGFNARGVPLLAAHSNDAFNRPLNTWSYERIRYIHVLGARTY